MRAIRCPAAVLTHLPTVLAGPTDLQTLQPRRASALCALWLDEVDEKGG
jgi:hypothetical protein